MTNTYLQEVDLLCVQKEKIKTKLKKILAENKDNKALNQYVKLLDKLDVTNDLINDLKKTDLYDELVDLPQNEFKITTAVVRVKKPYIRLDINTKKFISDNKKGSKLYNKYVKETVVKGSVTIVPNKED